MCWTIEQSYQGGLGEQEIEESGVQSTSGTCNQPQFEVTLRKKQEIIRRSIAI